MKPDLPLPWGVNEYMDWTMDAYGETVNDADYKYLIHACNAYPRLVECMKTFVEHDLYNPSAIAAEILLKELGEL